ncbi:putative holin [Pseudodesulfovibrio sp.]|uniref:putative holin n=1 Tax=Pseudodesulfovibrio sp. TaxID=2035812 RepID=UPI00260D92D9|nr:putative holin [Pseudodesulfovibrio sp.]MDD3310971.1 putative holin [Pseudodesulfovibrio sp.]
MSLPRMTKTTTLALLLAVAVALLAPQQLPVIVYKLALVVLAGVAGYILDRALFPYARPDHFLPPPDAPCETGCCGPSRLFVAAQLRRAAIVAAAMLAVGMGL